MRKQTPAAATAAVDLLRFVALGILASNKLSGPGPGVSSNGLDYLHALLALPLLTRTRSRRTCVRVGEISGAGGVGRPRLLRCAQRPPKTTFIVTVDHE